MLLLDFLQRWILRRYLPRFPQRAYWSSKLPRSLLTHHLERAVSTTSFPKTARKSPVPETLGLAYPVPSPTPGLLWFQGTLYITLAELIDLVWLKRLGWRRIDQSLDSVVLGFSTRGRNWQVMLGCVRPKGWTFFLSLPFLSLLKCCTFYSCKTNKRGHNISHWILSRSECKGCFSLGTSHHPESYSRLPVSAPAPWLVDGAHSLTSAAVAYKGW